MLNHCLSRSKFVNTHLYHPSQWFNIHIKFLLPLSQRVFLNWSLFSLLAVIDPRLMSPHPDHLLPHLSKLQTVLFNIHAAPSLWNELPHSFREPHRHLGLSPSDHPTHVGSTLSSLAYHFHHQFTPSLFRSRVDFLKSQTLFDYT